MIDCFIYISSQILLTRSVFVRKFKRLCRLLPKIAPAGNMLCPGSVSLNKRIEPFPKLFICMIGIEKLDLPVFDAHIGHPDRNIRQRMLLSPDISIAFRLCEMYFQRFGKHQHVRMHAFDLVDRNIPFVIYNSVSPAINNQHQIPGQGDLLTERYLGSIIGAGGRLYGAVYFSTLKHGIHASALSAPLIYISAPENEFNQISDRYPDCLHFTPAA